MATSPSNYDPGQELSDLDFSALIGGPLGAIVDAQSKAALSTVDFVKSIGFTPDSEDETTGEITPGEPIYVSFKYPKMVQPYQAAVPGKDAIEGSVQIQNRGTGYTNTSELIVGVIKLKVTGVDTAGEITSFIVNGYTTGNDIDDVTNGDNLSPSATTGGGLGATFEISGYESSIPTKAAVPAVFDQMKLEVPILTMMPLPFIRVEEGNIDFNAKITSMEYSRIGSEFKLGANLSVDNQNTRKKYSFSGKSLKYRKNVNTVNLKTNVSYQRNTKQGTKVDKTFHLGVKIKVSQDEMPEGMEKLLGMLEGAIVAQPA